MNGTAIYNSMKKLISKKYYATKEIALQKLDTLFACNRLTDTEYADLVALCDSVYGG